MLIFEETYVLYYLVEIINPQKHLSSLTVCLFVCLVTIMEIRINLTYFQINFRSKDISFRYVYILDIKILIAEAQITKDLLSNT